MNATPRILFLLLFLIIFTSPANAELNITKDGDLTATEFDELGFDTTGLVGYWQLNGNANDASGQGNNGTIVGATATTDRFGTANMAMSFNGASYITLAENLLDGAVAGTVEMWFKRGAWTESFTTLLTKSNNIAWVYNHIQISQNSNANTINLTISNNISSTMTNVVTGNINQGEWYQIAMTWNGVVLVGYLNGIEIGRTNTAIAIPSDSTRFAIGRGAVNSNRYFNGSIDEVKIFNRALSDAEILSMYNHEKGKFSVGNDGTMRALEFVEDPALPVQMRSKKESLTVKGQLIEQ